MPTVPLVDIAGKKRSERTLSDTVFGVKPNRHLLYEAVESFSVPSPGATRSSYRERFKEGRFARPFRFESAKERFW